MWTNGLLAIVAMVHGAKTAPRKKTQGRRLVEHPLRKRILDAIRRITGINETRLRAESGLARGTLRHHLGLLERGGTIRALKLGRERHYLLNDGDGARAEAIARISHGRALEVLRQVLLHPGVPQNLLAKHCRMSREVLRKYLDLLQEGNLIREHAAGRTRRYYPGKDADPRIWELFDLPKARVEPPPLEGPTRGHQRFQFF